MNNAIDSAIDDLIEAAGIESPARRAFELVICRRRLEAKIQGAVEEAEAAVSIWFEMEAG